MFHCSIATLGKLDYEEKIKGEYLPLTAESVTRLNLVAAIKGKNMNAYTQSLVYAEMGMEKKNKREILIFCM
jgi:hypothetical protein